MLNIQCKTLNKYDKKTLKRKITPTALLAATAITYFGSVQDSDAGVVWLASDDGTNLTLTTSGTLNTGAITTTAPLTTTTAGNLFLGDTSAVYATPVGDDRYLATLAAATRPNDPWIVNSSSANSATGHSFGHNDLDLYWSSAFGATPGTITPVTTMVFNNLTIATAFGSNLDAGPVVIFQLPGAAGDTISIGRATPIPEPSSTALLGLGGLALILRRRK